jgi:acyl-CoA oxidase
MLNKVRIPRKYMLGKFKEVSKEGKLITKEGDERIAYATMMKIRLLISTTWQKVYGQLITIATRYSMFRKQFKGKHGI